MATKQTVNNLKLGIFVTSGLLLLVFLLYMIGRDENLFGSNFTIKARFHNVSGLTKGNNVRYAGIQVGTVKKVVIINDSVIEVTMQIRTEVQSFIRKNAIAAIGTEGLVGNKIVNIFPLNGSSPQVEENDLLQTQVIINTDDMLIVLNRTNNNISEISEEIRRMVHRINDSKVLWNLLNETKLLTSLKASMENIERATANANILTEQLNVLVADVKSGKGSLGELLTDTTISYNITQTLNKIKTVGDNANKLSEELNKLVSEVKTDFKNSKGMVNTLLNDTTIVTSLKSTLTNIEEGTSSFNQNMEALKHNFFFRGYFKKLEKQQRKEEEERKKEAEKKNKGN